jgi:hypothetical protein
VERLRGFVLELAAYMHTASENDPSTQLTSALSALNTAEPDARFKRVRPGSASAGGGYGWSVDPDENAFDRAGVSDGVAQSAARISVAMDDADYSTILGELQALQAVAMSSGDQMLASIVSRVGAAAQRRSLSDLAPVVRELTLHCGV